MEISNVRIFGMEDSIRASKFPKAVRLEDLNTTLTDGIEALAHAPIGSGHDNWLNGVIVQFDLTASLKFWPQMQRYHFIDFVSSQSTMHRIAKFNISNQCNEYVTDQAIENLEWLVAHYAENPTNENYLKCLYNIPSGFNLTARLTTNYRQLKTIYSQRCTHRLPEWQQFCDWVERLPRSYLITGHKAHGDDVNGNA